MSVAGLDHHGNLAKLAVWPKQKRTSVIAGFLFERLLYFLFRYLLLFAFYK